MIGKIKRTYIYKGYSIYLKVIGWYDGLFKFPGIKGTLDFIYI